MLPLPFMKIALKQLIYKLLQLKSEVTQGNISALAIVKTAFSGNILCYLLVTLGVTSKRPWHYQKPTNVTFCYPFVNGFSGLFDGASGIFRPKVTKVTGNIWWISGLWISMELSTSYPQKARK